MCIWYPVSAASLQAYSLQIAKGLYSITFIFISDYEVDWHSFFDVNVASGASLTHLKGL